MSYFSDKRLDKYSYCTGLVQIVASLALSGGLGAWAGLTCPCPWWARVLLCLVIFSGALLTSLSGQMLLELLERTIKKGFLRLELRDHPVKARDLGAALPETPFVIDKLPTPTGDIGQIAHGAGSCGGTGEGASAGAKGGAR